MVGNKLFYGLKEITLVASYFCSGTCNCGILGMSLRHIQKV